MLRCLFIVLTLCLGFKSYTQPTSGINTNVAMIGGDGDSFYNDVFVNVEEMPEFPGGVDGLMKYLAYNVNYPRFEKQNSIQGTAYVYFMVNIDGSVTDAKITKTSGSEALDNEALRVVRNMPKYTPGKLNGKPAKVEYTLPIKFKLGNEETVSYRQTIGPVKQPAPNNSGVAPDTSCSEIFLSVEEMPKFPGGEDAMLKYLSSNINYPKTEMNNQVQGTVYVYFVINKRGKVAEARVMRGVKDGPGLDQEALRVVNSMPGWSIGKQNGRPACVQFTLPIKFQLKNGK